MRTSSDLSQKTPSMTQNAGTSSSRRLIGADVRIKIVDIGANAVDGIPPCVPPLQAAAA